MSERNLSDWFAAYGASHQNPVNKKIHFVCVPVIFLTIVGFLWVLPVPAWMGHIPWLNWATLALVLTVLFYLRLSWTIAAGMALFSALCLAVILAIDRSGMSVGITSAIVFVLAWIGQFVGHAVEGKKPSFFEDLQFLMIGPAWILGFLYRKAGIPC